MRLGLSSVLLAPFLVFLAMSVTPAQAQQRTLCVHGLEAPTALLVRSGPGPNNSVIGRFPAKSCGIKLAGRCSGDWCQMAQGKTYGWVKTTHIAVYELPGAPAKDAGSAAVAATAPPEQPESTATAEPPQRAARAEPPRRVAKAEPAVRRQTRRVREPRQEEQGSKDDGTCVTRVDDDDTLRIRRGPGVRHDEIAELPPNACGIAVSDRCRGSWCRVAWRGRAGWVNTYYLD